jgi:hypothetical protein
MFYPPTIPINFLTFLLLSLFWGGVSLAFTWKTGDRSREFWVLHVLTGFFGGLASLGLLTAISFIPDDWSACRLSWSGGILCGYNLYSGEAGPANGFFYPPVGAWFYILPAAFGLLFKSAQISLFIGWLMSLLCMLLPIFFLLRRAKNSSPSSMSASVALPCFFVGLGFILALPQLRYFATMVHVDSPSAFFLGISIVLILPLCNSKNYRSKLFFASGSLFSLAAMTKQSVWPVVPVLGIGLLLFYGWKNTLKFALAGIATLILVAVCLLISGENFYQAYKMIWHWPMRQASITPVWECLRQLWLLNIPLLAASVVLIFILIWRKIRIERKFLKSILFLLALGAWLVPFSILTRTKIGADTNHLALPSFFILMALILLLYQILSFEILNKNAFLSSTLTALPLLIVLVCAFNPYFKTYCGWYLWCNNSHSQALKYEMHNQSTEAHSRFYFPWQIFSTLIATGKLYHIDDCLRYEESAGWKRPKESFYAFLPPQPFQIATRQFGAPSYICEKLGMQKIVPESTYSNYFPNWAIFIGSPKSQLNTQ